MRTLFLVEDNAADVELFRLAIDGACLDCDLKIFSDGRSIVDYARAQGSAASPVIPELIVLDLNLPRLDGIEVLQLLRETPGFGEVPVAALSSSSSPRDQRRLNELKVAAYIVKPADLDAYLEIGNKVAKLLDKQPA